MTTAATGLPDRFTTPLYTVMEAAQYLDVPASSLAWPHGRMATGGTPRAGPRQPGPFV